MNRPLIFLDIDGVLNSNAYLSARPMLAERDETLIDPDAVKLLDRLIRASGAALVISSTWRLELDVATIGKILARRGLRRGIPISRTPERPGRPRGEEITAFLRKEGDRPPYVILDDDSDMPGHGRHLVQTDPRYGLLPGDVDRALAILKPR
jgi:hypothetical protein